MMFTTKQTTAGLALLTLLALAPGVRAQTAVPRDGKFEAAFTLTDQTGNPFDPQANDVDATFTGPDKTPVVVPAFWDGDRWRVRFAPTQVGAYTLSLTRNGTAEHPADLTADHFTCTASTDPGFVRRDPATVQRFVLDSGQAFYPLGMNVAWNNGGQDYPTVFAHMGQAQMNWARVWTTSWDGKNLEWASDSTHNPKIGEYLIDAARRWDMIFDEAQKSNVYVQMVLQHHGQYTANTDPNWASNPFNVANGGFLQKPDDFFTNAQARTLTRNKYRYTVARWGYSTHLMAWELFNEVQNITEVRSHFSDVVNWHKEMADYIRSVDVNHHLLTTSNSPSGDPLSQIGLDYDQMHTYPPDVISTFAGVRTTDINAPLFYGEWGPSPVGANPVHDGLWASLMTPTAGAGQFWDWDTVIKNNRWAEFASAAGFTQNFDVTSLGATAPIHPTVSAPGPRGSLQFAPSGDWGPTTRTDITLPADGSQPDMSGVSSFIQGQYHRDYLPRPLAFHFTAALPCQFQVQVGQVATAGARLTLSLDGKQLAQQNFPATTSGYTANQTVSVTVPVGTHTVSLYNTGTDWFVARSITVTDFVPGVAVLAKGNAHGVLFWAYNRDRTDTAPRSATLRFAGLAAGPYHVRLWDTAAGKSRTGFGVTVQAGKSTAVALPAFTGDIAGDLVPSGAKSP